MAKTFGCVRFIYNRMLGDKIEHYQQTGKNLYCYPAQYKTEFPWVKEVGSLALGGAYNNLQAAYRSFFRDDRVGFPKFKSKHKGKYSYTTNLVNNNISLGNGRLKLPKLGSVKIKQYRQIPAGHKLEDQSRRLIMIDKWYPSSKTCSKCGAVKPDLALSERVYRCACGYVEDRDLNAAINIQEEGKRQLAA